MGTKPLENIKCGPGILKMCKFMNSNNVFNFFLGFEIFEKKFFQKAISSPNSNMACDPNFLVFFWKSGGPTKFPRVR
jgi:hypothetical protein